MADHSYDALHDDDPRWEFLRSDSEARVITAASQDGSAFERDSTGSEDRVSTRLIAPLRDQTEDPAGLLEFTYHGPNSELTDIDHRLRTVVALGNLLMQLFARVAAQEENARRLAHEDLLRRVATTLTQSRDADDAGLRAALAALVQGTGLDTASLWSITPVKDRPGGRVFSLLSHSDPGMNTTLSAGGSRTVDLSPDLLASTPGPGEAVDLSFADLHGWVFDLYPEARTSGRLLLVSELSTGPALTLLVGTAAQPGPLPADVVALLESALALVIQHHARVAAERWFASAFESAPTAITLRDNRSRLVACNPAFEDFVGRSRETMIGQRLDEFLADPAQAGLPDFEAPVDGAGGGVEVAYRNADGSIAWGRVRSRSITMPGEVEPMVMSHIEDVTEGRRARQLLEYQAAHDDLTGLPNRRAFVTEVSVEVARSLDCAVLVLDLDRFKVVNDSLGHSVGDQLLVTCADRIRLSLRPGDSLCRLGGDEFAVLLRSPAGGPEASAVASRLLQLLREPVQAGEEEVFPTASTGVAVPAPGDEMEDVLRHADAAMYQAKARGRDRFEVFDGSMQDAVVERAGRRLGSLGVERGHQANGRLAGSRQRHRDEGQPLGSSAATGTTRRGSCGARGDRNSRGVTLPGDYRDRDHG